MSFLSIFDVDVKAKSFVTSKQSTVKTVNVVDYLNDEEPAKMLTQSLNTHPIFLLCLWNASFMLEFTGHNTP